MQTWACKLKILLCHQTEQPGTLGQGSRMWHQHPAGQGEQAVHQGAETHPSQASHSLFPGGHMGGPGTSSRGSIQLYSTSYLKDLDLEGFGHLKWCLSIRSAISPSTILIGMTVLFSCTQTCHMSQRGQQWIWTTEYFQRWLCDTEESTIYYCLM